MESENGILKLVTYPSGVLRTICEPVREFDGSLRDQIRQMKQIMHDSNGLGIAANQCGATNCVIILDKTVLGDTTEMINPIITDTWGKQSSLEGSLSIPGYTHSIRRKNTIDVRYQTVRGAIRNEKIVGRPSATIQHLVEYLNGRLFIDKLPHNAKKEFKRKYGDDGYES